MQHCRVLAEEVESERNKQDRRTFNRPRNSELPEVSA